MKIHSHFIKRKYNINKFYTNISVVFLLVCFTLNQSHATSLTATPPAQSLEHNGIRYVAPNSNPELGYLQVWDASQNRLLYTVNRTVNSNQRPGEQFIRKLAVVDNWLVVTELFGRKYYFDIESSDEMQLHHIDNMMSNGGYTKNITKIKDKRKKDKKKKHGGKKKSKTNKSTGNKKYHEKKKSLQK